MNSKSRTSLFGILLAIVLLLFSLPAIKKVFEPSWTLEKFQSQSLTWKSCYTSYQCATLVVPVDYENIGKEVFHLQVLRHQATKPGSRIGAIVVNPGGPGGSGVDYAYGATEIVSTEINQRFDIVGFDPRGVASSEPFRCLDDKATDQYLASDGKADTPAQQAELINSSKVFAESCAKVAGSRLGHYSTLETAKDMELLRRALGEPKLNFLGKSYGTYLGTLYAALYPQYVGRFVLDGAIDPNVSIKEQNLVQAKGFDLALADFLKQSKKITLKDITTLITTAESHPLVSSSGRKLTPALIMIAIASSLYDNVEGWPELTAALLAAKNKNNPLPLLDLSDGYTNRDKSGHYQDNQNDISQVISCLDWKDSRSFAQMKADSAKFAQQAPIFGPFLAYAGLPCDYWQAPPVTPTMPLTKIAAPPILIIGVTKDPATPYQWAQALHNDFPDSILLTLVGEGHTGHNRGNSCIDSQVDKYFLTGKISTKSVVCNA